MLINGHVERQSSVTHLCFHPARDPPEHMRGQRRALTLGMLVYMSKMIGVCVACVSVCVSYGFREKLRQSDAAISDEYRDAEERMGGEGWDVCTFEQLIYLKIPTNSNKYHHLFKL